MKQANKEALGQSQVKEIASPLSSHALVSLGRAHRRKKGKDTQQGSFLRLIQMMTYLVLGIKKV